VDDDAEHDRRDDHRDELEKAIAEYLEALREVRRIDADQNAEDRGDQDLEKERMVYAT